MTLSPIPLRLRLPYATEGEFLDRLAPSLSRGGFFVSTPKPHPSGARIAFRFLLRDGLQVLAGEASVIRTIEPGGEARPGMALRFESFEGSSRDRIAHLLGERPQLAAKAPKGNAPAQVKSPAAGDEPEPVLGIDLGTTGCRAAVFHLGEVRPLELEGRHTALPSFVAFDDKGRLLLGTRAKAQLLVDPKNTLFGTKRLLGRRARSPKVQQMAGIFPFELCADEEGETAVQVREGRLSPAQIAAHLLGEVRNRASEVLGRPVQRAVLCVPAYFNDRQQCAVRSAAKLAGLTVERIVTEPVAIGVAYAQGRGLARKRLLIFDLGGGTFDASVLEVTGDDFTVLASGGDNFLGGLDFDARLSHWLEERFCEKEGLGPLEDPITRQRLRDAAETAKIALSERTETLVHVPWIATRAGAPVDLRVELDRATLEELTGDLIDRALEVTRAVLETCGLGASALDEVILVGGQSQAPLVQTALEKMLGRTVSREVDPHDAVAIGAALVGRAMRDEPSELFELRCSEVLSSPIGFALADGALSRVFERNTPLPAEKTLSVRLDPAAMPALALFQGESRLAEENEYLGSLGPEAQGPTPGELQVTLALSRDGALSVFTHAKDGKRVARGLTLAQSPFSPLPHAAAAEPLGEKPPRSSKILRPFKRLFARR